MIVIMGFKTNIVGLCGIFGFCMGFTAKITSTTQNMFMDLELLSFPPFCILLPPALIGYGFGKIVCLDINLPYKQKTQEQEHMCNKYCFPLYVTGFGDKIGEEYKNTNEVK